ncbi:hypothetical protein, partial [Neisseria meningitidis]|uniref:hypothetical protein n=1 Tax=Neisseria meningitidis TaxID=487 RepID=UPI001C8F9FD2
MPSPKGLDSRLRGKVWIPACAGMAELCLSRFTWLKKGRCRLKLRHSHDYRNLSSFPPPFVIPVKTG